MNLEPFIVAHLPAAPTRVLEVGCGRGALAHAMARLGHEVLAIDPGAPDGAPFQRVALEDLADPGPFDAVVASRSLHHIHDLPGAVARIASLLAPGGRPFAWTPYLHGELGLEPDAERWAIETGAIRATGFLYVGERRPPAPN
jgi:2-polyprenyl-3-methyl-5-hydroxy-6-metoxy-1,4-benzoquinol methylase